jgi:hypothetical protein
LLEPPIAADQHAQFGVASGNRRRFELPASIQIQ